MYRLGSVASQLCPFGIAVQPTALLHATCNTLASSFHELWGPGSCLTLKSSKLQDINQIHLLQEAVQKKAVKMTLP